MNARYSILKNGILCLGVITLSIGMGYAASSSIDCGATGANSTALQPAIDALAAGDTLTISGQCIGNFKVNINNASASAITFDGRNVGTIASANTTSGLIVSSNSKVILKGLIIIPNYSTVNVAEGGAIHNSGNLTINTSTVKGIAIIRGGAIFNDGIITIESSQIINSGCANFDSTTGHLVNCFGAGIYNSGSLKINNSIFNNDTGIGVGGGIYNVGTLEINASVFSKCDSAILGFGGALGAGGGAIFNDIGGTLKLTNSTLFNNFGTSGGGIANTNANNGSVIITNSTLTKNIFFDLGGGGINNASNVASAVLIKNSIVAGNLEAATLLDSSDIFGPFSQAGTNIIGSVDPKLEDLADNGGPTQTAKPLPDSPAINGTDCDPLITVDQRGAPRPGILGAGVKSKCDIGAYETGDMKIVASPNPLAFGDQTVNSPIKDPITLTNAGNLVATFLSGVTSGADAASFVFSNTDNVTKLDIAQANTVYVTFTPSATRNFLANLDLTFYYDANRNSSFDTGETSTDVNVTLEGSGSVVSPTQISKNISALANSIKSGAAGVIGTGSGKVALNHLNAYVNMLTTAANLVTANDYIDACTQLYDAAVKADGSNKNPNPPDFIQDATSATHGAKTRAVYRSIYNIMSSELFCTNLPPNLPSL